MILNTRLRTAALAVLLAGSALAGLAVAQGPPVPVTPPSCLDGGLAQACSPSTTGPVGEACRFAGIPIQCHSGAFATVDGQLNTLIADEYETCTSGPTDAAALCIVGVALGGGPAVSPDDLCDSVPGADPDGTISDCVQAPPADPDAILAALDALCDSVPGADPDGKVPDCVHAPPVDTDGIVAAVDDLCDSIPGADPDGTISDCVQAPPADTDGILAALDDLCGTIPGSDPDGTISDCVQAPPADPDAILAALDDLCDSAPDADPDGTFPFCVQLPPVDTDGIIAAVADVVAPHVTSIAADHPVAAVGQLVTVSGGFSTFLSAAAPVSSALPLDDVTIAVSGVSGALASVNNTARTFTVAFTPSAAGQSTVTVTLTYVAPLNALATTPLAPLTFGTDAASVVADTTPVADAGASQDVDKLAAVTLDGSGSSDPDGDALTYAWTQVSGTAVTLTGANTATASFTAPDVSSLTDLVFHLVVSDGVLSDSDDTTIHVSPPDGITGTVGMGDGGITLRLDATGFAGPVAGAASSTGITAILHSSNGVGRLDNSKLAASLTGPQGLDETLAYSSTADSNPEGDGLTQRDFQYDLAFPARLKGGAYQFVASYNGSAPVTDTFTVANAAPTLGITAPVTQTFTAGHGAIATDPVSLSLDDANWGGYAGSVTELDALTLAGVPSGLAFQVSTDGGSTWAPVGSLSDDLSAVQNGAGALGLKVRLASADGAVADGPATVTAVLRDEAGATSGTVTLFTLTILPQNYGFLFGVDDGGDGIAFAAANPGNRTSSAADPVAVSFDGTFDADALVVSIGDFACSCGDSFSPYNADPAKNAKVLLYGTPDLSDTPLQAAIGSTGDAGFDLSGSPLGAAGSALYVVLDIYLPYGHARGSYTSTVDIQATGDGS